MFGPPQGIAFLLLACWWSVSVSGADWALSAGAARLEITPPTNVLNWVTSKPYEGVLDPIFVHALVLSDGRTRVAFVCWDLVDTREGMVAKVRSAIETAVGIPQANILINASHNHSGPFSPTLGDPLIAIDRKAIDPVEHSPGHRDWTEALLQHCVEAVQIADKARRPASLAIGRAWAGDVLFNRRPIREDGKVETTFQPANPYTLPRGQRFGPMDPTLTILAVRDDKGQSIATLFSLPCHSVCIYGTYRGISADWPGAACERMQKALGGEVLFAQGCAGDIVPARRGVAERDNMARIVCERALPAAANSHPLPAARLQTSRIPVTLNLTPAAEHDFGAKTITSEVQVISYGTFALAALPGEPLTGISLEIQKRSPFLHTLVLGYSNGNGVEYVGLPGEKVRGGYEMGESGEGTDDCGQVLMDAADRALRSLWTR